MLPDHILVLTIGVSHPYMSKSKDILGKKDHDQTVSADEGHSTVSPSEVQDAPKGSGSDIHKMLMDVNRQMMGAQEQPKMSGLLEDIELLQRCKTFPIRPEDLERAGGIGDAYTKARLKPE